MAVDREIIARLEADYPGWHVWLGVSSLWYARRVLSSPPVIVRATNLTELREAISEHASRGTQGNPGPGFRAFRSATLLILSWG
jgi:hypothetical protein